MLSRLSCRFTFMRLSLPKICLFLLLLTGLLILSLPARGASPPSGPVAQGIGTFEAVCDYSHRAKDDPIVFPRGPGAAHSHDFFGARNTSAFSTNESIRKAPTSCVRYSSAKPDMDRSAYWAPTLYVNGEAVNPTKVGAYYSTGICHQKMIKSFPSNLRVIAGQAGGGPQEVNGERVWFYMCRGGTLQPGSASRAPLCADQSLELVMRFPDCWDGKRLDSSDHQSHMAYSRRKSSAPVRTCPSTHPSLVPALQMSIKYPTQGGASVRLASGGINSAHADFMNGWDKERFSALVINCLRVDKYCGGGDKPE